MERIEGQSKYRKGRIGVKTNIPWSAAVSSSGAVCCLQRFGVLSPRSERKREKASTVVRLTSEPLVIMSLHSPLADSSGDHVVNENENDNLGFRYENVVKQCVAHDRVGCVC